jgi:osmotically-inducible protein OsmY
VRNRWLCVVPLILAPMLSGCVYVAATGVVAGVSAARQERTIGNAVDDVRIKTELSSSLVQQSADNFVNVSSTVFEGRVLLTGRVSSPEARLDASRIAWSVEGVRKVDNDIAVTEDGQWLHRPMDIYIRTKLAADLLTDSDIRDVNYTIDVVNGVVYLMGVGQDQAEIDRAVADARAIPQVKRVENYVVLKTDPIRYGMAASAQPHTPPPAPRAAQAAEPPDAGDDSDNGDDADESDPGDSDGDSSRATGAPTPLTH